MIACLFLASRIFCYLVDNDQLLCNYYTPRKYLAKDMSSPINFPLIKKLNYQQLKLLSVELINSKSSKGLTHD